MLASQNMYPSKGRCVHVFNEQVGSFQNIEDSFWVPLISGPVLSILDLAPLNIVGRYMDDVYTGMSFRSFQVFFMFYNHMLVQKFNLCMLCHWYEILFIAVQDYRHRPVKSSSDAPFEREPLFPLPSFPLYTEANSEVLRGPNTSAVNMVSSTASQQLPKKTMVAALVESTKEIVKLAQRFFSFLQSFIIST